MKKQVILWLLLLFGMVGCSVAEGPAETPTATATATEPLMPTSTLTPSPTATPTPLPTPTPTPLPGERLAQAEAAYRRGDWEGAEALYRSLIDAGDVAPEERARGVIGTGKTLMAQGDHATAAAFLLSSSGEGGPELPPEAHLYIADALKASGDPAGAAAHYALLQESYPLLTPYTLRWRGDAHFAAGDYGAALTAYEEALALAASTSDQVFLREKIALTYAALSDPAAALESYDAILAVAQVPSYRARIMYQAADTALIFGDAPEAYRRMHQLIADYPSQSYAYEALIKLVNAGEPVDMGLRGLIDYYAEAYGPAVEAFANVVNSDPEHDGEPHYYAGLSYLEAESYALALQEFETLIETHPDDYYWGSAWVAKAQTLASMGRIEEALAAYRTLPDEIPDHARAPASLWDAARLLEREERFSEAAEAYMEMAERYPNDEGAPEAYFKAGLLRYREGDPEGARDVWRALARRYPTHKRARAADFWVGKSYLQAGNVTSATVALEGVVAGGAWDFYGLRAADLLAGREPFAQAGSAPPACGTPEEQLAAETWLAGWLGLESAAGLGELTPELRSDPRLQRGTLLLQFGHFAAGRAALAALRAATVNDAATQYRLALYFREIGLYRSSIIAASTVWRLSPIYDTRDLPRFVGCLIYPTYYGDLVEAEAASQEFDPLVVYALLRQESLFEGAATSYAAAHGLMQVIPPTGAEIAAALSWPPGYETPDLYRPMVSVRFGVWYLAQQRNRLDGDLFAAMAAYNGGPGNSARWWQAAGGDPDLFVELISLTETRSYVERIREHYARYRWFYRGDEP